MWRYQRNVYLIIFVGWQVFATIFSCTHLKDIELEKWKIKLVSTQAIKILKSPSERVVGASAIS